MICILYTPRFRTPVSGCFVAIKPNVMKRPASSGHDFMIGKSSNEASVDVTSVTNPLDCDLGNDAVIFESSGSFLILFNKPDGISIFVMSVIRCPISVKSVISSPISSLFIEPNAFPNTGIVWPFTFSKRIAGPFEYISLLKISAISKSWSTSVLTLFNSPCFSSSIMNS